MKKLQQSGIIILIAFLISCNTEHKNKLSEKSILIKTDTLDSKAIQDNVYYVFPSPNELMEIIRESELSFSSELLNSPSNASDYTTKTAIDLNIGVYLADLAYCGLFQRKKEVLLYQEALSRLSSNIYLSTSLKLKLNDLRKQNAASTDSMPEIIEKLFYDIVNDLESNQQQKTVAVICAGSYIESLYISLNSFVEFDPQNPVFLKLAEQQFAFKNMIAYMRQFESNNEIKQLIKQVVEIEKIYNNLNFTQKKISVKHTSDENIIVSGGKVYQIDKLSFEKLLINTKAIRQDFITRK
jgi:hypothetical protein